jgi:hypothetical protein
LAARYRLPAVYPFRFFVTSGGLMSYGPDTRDPYQRAAGYWLALGAVVPRGELLGQFRAPPHVDKYTPDGRIPSAAELA